MADPKPKRGVVGRTRLLDAAERLLDEQGLDGMSVRKVTTEAGHRNVSAVSYHFGTRTDLIRAVLARRQVGLEARRSALLDEVEAAGPVEPRAALIAALAPMVELLDDLGGRRYLRLLFQATVHPSFGEATALDLSPSVSRAVLHVSPLVGHLSPERAVARLRLTLEVALLALASHSRLVDTPNPPLEPLDGEVFMSDLLDVMMSALAA